MDKILVINLGGTSSKIAIYTGEEVLDEISLSHSISEMEKYQNNSDQVVYRSSLIKDWLNKLSIDMKTISAVAVRGGNIPIELSKHGGTYFLDNELKEVILNRYSAEEQFYHGVIISVPIALDLIGDSEIPIYITDPPTINEMLPVAKISGHPKFERLPVFHALNQRAVARKAAEEIGKEYANCRFIVVHLGAGVSVGAHFEGKVIDVNNCTRGDGPMSPNRGGQFPIGQLIDACFSGDYEKNELMRMARGDGGVKSYLGTDDIRTVEKQVIHGDEKSKLIWDAFSYQVAKEIGSIATVLDGQVDRIIYTGGISNSVRFIEETHRKVSFIAEKLVFPGEFENEGLALGALRVLTGVETPVNINK